MLNKRLFDRKAYTSRKFLTFSKVLVAHGSIGEVCSQFAKFSSMEDLGKP